MFHSALICSTLRSFHSAEQGMIFGCYHSDQVRSQTPCAACTMHLRGPHKDVGDVAADQSLFGGRRQLARVQAERLSGQDGHKSKRICSVRLCSAPFHMMLFCPGLLCPALACTVLLCNVLIGSVRSSSLGFCTVPF